METLLFELLVNSAIAAVLALAAWGIWRRFGNAPITHGLLVLALLKLVTPALWRLRVLSPEAADRAGPTHLVSSVPVALEDLDLDSLMALSARLDPPVAASTASAWTPVLPLFVAWALGALIVALLIRRRARRCALLLDFAGDAPEGIDAMVRDLAARAGLRNAPRVHVVDARISPFAFHWNRRPTIALPRAVVDGLDGRELRAVVAHEIAHLAHRDHLTRWLEVAVAVVHWWNPIARFVRACVREVEEVRTDARAVALLESGSRHYGRTILKATSYVEGDLRGLPLGASGLGGSKSMEKRLTMIANDKLSYRAPLTARVLLALGAATLLPLGVTAQESSKQDVTEEIRALRKEIQELRARLEKLQGDHVIVRGRTTDPFEGPRVMSFDEAGRFVIESGRSKKTTQKKSKAKDDDEDADDEDEDENEEHGGHAGVWQIHTGDDEGKPKARGNLVWRMVPEGEHGEGVHYFIGQGQGAEDDDDAGEGNAKVKSGKQFVFGVPGGGAHFEFQGKPMVFKAEGLQMDPMAIQERVLKSLKAGRHPSSKDTTVLRIDNDNDTGGQAGFVLEKRIRDQVMNEVKELHGKALKLGSGGAFHVIQETDGDESPGVIILRSKQGGGDGEEVEEIEVQEAPKAAAPQKRLRVQKVEKAEKVKDVQGRKKIAEESSTQSETANPFGWRKA